MKRADVYQEIKSIFGLVPTFMQQVPDNTLESEWDLMRKLVVEEQNIPHKYKELIGIGIAAATKCQYCVFFHTQLAILFGATPQEIEEAVHYAKNSTGWSTYLHGTGIELNDFKKEITQMCEFVKESHAEHA